MMFYNGFNLMIDIILVTATVYFMKWKDRRDYVYNTLEELNYEYNQGWEAGYNQALRNKNNNQEWK